METYIVQQVVYGLIAGVTSKAGDLIKMRPEDAAQFLADGVLVKQGAKIKTKEEKATKK
jgi:DNA mismatch repair protein MutH